MKAQETILEAIGNTPLVKLQRVVGPDDATVLCKCEFLNPSGSIKDRLVLHTLEQALARGEIAPGGTVVENTSGNTGAALATWAAVRGMRCIFTIPDKMSREKIDTLKALGGEVVVCPTAVPADSPESYYETAKRLARDEGLFVGGSSGGSVYVALQLARELGRGKTIVAICTDGGKSYISKFYSDEWMRQNGFGAALDGGVAA